jgi:hypothetical protein
VSVRLSTRSDSGLGTLAYLRFSAGPPGAAAKGLQIKLEFAFLDDPLMRLVKALDAILTIMGFGRKQLGDLVDAACRAGAMEPGTVKHALPDPELMIAQAIHLNCDVRPQQRKRCHFRSC